MATFQAFYTAGGQQQIACCFEAASTGKARAEAERIIAGAAERSPDAAEAYRLWQEQGRRVRFDGGAEVPAG